VSVALFELLPLVVVGALVLLPVEVAVGVPEVVPVEA
jgi:hypothetical protein